MQMQMQIQRAGTEVEFKIISDHWCMQIFRAFECTLHEFQQIVVLSCAA